MKGQIYQQASSLNSVQSLLQTKLLSDSPYFLARVHESSLGNMGFIRAFPQPQYFRSMDRKFIFTTTINYSRHDGFIIFDR